MNKIIGGLFVLFVVSLAVLFLLIPKTETNSEQEVFVLTEEFSHLTQDIYVDEAGEKFAAVENRGGTIYVEKVKLMIFETMMKYDVSYRDAKQMVYD